MKNKFNIQYRKNQSAVLILIFLAGLLLLSGLCQTSAAQVIRTNQPPQVKPTPPPPQRKTTVFKGTGRIQSDPEAEQFRQIPAFAPLTQEEKQNLLTGALSESGLSQIVGMVKTYVKLDPQNIFVRDRGFVNFYNAELVGSALWNSNALIPYAIFKGQSQPRGVAIRLKPARAGQLLLIDCVVYSHSTGFFSGSPFRITGPDGSWTEKNIEGTGHLQAFILSQNTDWQKLKIERNTGDWMFISCEVTEGN